MQLLVSFLPFVRVQSKDLSAVDAIRLYRRSRINGRDSLQPSSLV